MNARRFLVVLLVALLVAACGDGAEGLPRIPAKTVVLTFDDAVRNQLTEVVPILRECGFEATFFITPGFHDETGAAYLDWDGIAKFHSS